MKNLLSFVFLISFTINGFSQKINLREDRIKLDGRLSNAWCGNLPGESDYAKKIFTDYIKDNFDVKVKKDGKEELSAKEVVVASVSPKSGDLVARFYTDNGQEKFGIGFLLGYEVSLNSQEHSVEMRKLEDLVKGYLTTYVAKYYADMIEDDMKSLKALNSDLTDNEKEISKLSKKIESNEKDILDPKKEDKKLDLTNENIHHKARIESLTAVNENLKVEINRLDEVLKKNRMEQAGFESELKN